MSDAPSLASVAEEIAAAKGLTNVEFIAKGAFKETYRVEDSDSNKLALKLIDSSKQSTDRISRELGAMLKVKNAHVSALSETGEFLASGGDRIFYFIEEYLGGGSLSQRLRPGPLKPSDVRRYAGHLMEGIGALNDAQLVHRDIKPDNILFRSSTDECVLVDLGLVRDLSDVSLTATWLGRGPGTPLFSAPEQLNNDKHLINWQTDQYSLGLVLGVCLTGKHPYDQPGRAPSDVVNDIASRHPLPRAFVDQIASLKFEPILRMLEPWPVRRYRSVSELISDLQQGGK